MDAMRYALLLALVAVAACAQTSVTRQAGGEVEIRHLWRHEGLYLGSTEQMPKEAADACPAGYTKLHDGTELVDGRTWLVWRVRCA